MATAKMKIILPIVVWMVLYSTTIAQSYGGIGFGIKREVFFLNLEDGYFGCQVNESTDVLQLFELSKLCDGTPNCFLGSDELTKELKCTNDCTKEDGTRCQNGACLDGQCHCNDGFGGCSCEVPDENECKYRPCDVFAHCTNTLGSFACTCYPGYKGDGFHCEDINECDDPAIASRCVENAWCCNLPAHFLCKCNAGYEGDGEVQCLDIDECANPNACGLNANCINTPGNYTCTCSEGYFGNPYDGCVDYDECQNPDACAPGAICTNVLGGRECHCPPGYDGDPYHSGCGDMDECSRSNPCGRNAICSNLDGSFKCACPPGFIGDPMIGCQDAECNSDLECPQEKACINFQCIDPCTLRGACGINALCNTVSHRPRCSCPECHMGMANTHCIPDEECLSTIKPRPTTPPPPCQKDNDCPKLLACNLSSGDCYDPCVDPSFKCKGNKKCEVSHHRPTCVCKNGFIVNERGEIACAPEVKECSKDEHCPSNKACMDGQCLNPCKNLLHPPCPPDKSCDVQNHRPTCICLKNCNPSLSICLRDNGCPPNQACRAFRCEDPCATANCLENTPCTVEDHKPICKACPAGLISNAKYGCVKDIKCYQHSDCTSHQACIEGKCQNPCIVSNPCIQSHDCQIQEHQPICVKVCQCQKHSDCGAPHLVCDGCKCVIQEEPKLVPGCEHCPPGIRCDPTTGACIRVTDMVTSTTTSTTSTDTTTTTSFTTLTETHTASLSQITSQPVTSNTILTFSESGTALQSTEPIPPFTSGVTETFATDFKSDDDLFTSKPIITLNPLFESSTTENVKSESLPIIERISDSIVKTENKIETTIPFTISDFTTKQTTVAANNDKSENSEIENTSTAYLMTTEKTGHKSLTEQLVTTTPYIKKEITTESIVSISTISENKEIITQETINQTQSTEIDTETGSDIAIEIETKSENVITVTPYYQEETTKIDDFITITPQYSDMITVPEKYKTTKLYSETTSDIGNYRVTEKLTKLPERTTSADLITVTPYNKEETVKLEEFVTVTAQYSEFPTTTENDKGTSEKLSEEYSTFECTTPKEETELSTIVSDGEKIITVVPISKETETEIKGFVTVTGQYLELPHEKSTKGVQTEIITDKPTSIKPQLTTVESNKIVTTVITPKELVTVTAKYPLMTPKSTTFGKYVTVTAEYPTDFVTTTEEQNETNQIFTGKEDLGMETTTDLPKIFTTEKIKLTETVSTDNVETETTYETYPNATAETKIFTEETVTNEILSTLEFITEKLTTLSSNDSFGVTSTQISSTETTVVPEKTNGNIFTVELKTQTESATTTQNLINSTTDQSLKTTIEAKYAENEVSFSSMDFTEKVTTEAPRTTITFPINTDTIGTFPTSTKKSLKTHVETSTVSETSPVILELTTERVSSPSTVLPSDIKTLLDITKSDLITQESILSTLDYTTTQSERQSMGTTFNPYSITSTQSENERSTSLKSIDLTSTDGSYNTIPDTETLIPIIELKSSTKIVPNHAETLFTSKPITVSEEYLTQKVKSIPDEGVETLFTSKTIFTSEMPQVNKGTTVKIIDSTIQRITESTIGEEHKVFTTVSGLAQTENEKYLTDKTLIPEDKISSVTTGISNTSQQTTTNSFETETSTFKSTEKSKITETTLSNLQSTLTTESKLTENPVSEYSSKSTSKAVTTLDNMIDKFTFSETTIDLQHETMTEPFSEKSMLTITPEFNETEISKLLTENTDKTIGTTFKSVETSEINIEQTTLIATNFSNHVSSNICNQNEDCLDFEICLNKMCISICSIGGRCASNAICKANNYTARCLCPQGYSGDPQRNCFKEPPHSKAPKPCESDMDCLDNEACYMSVCQDPCEFTNACAETAKCLAKMHRPICTCPMGLEGNPAIKCFKSPTMSCTTNNDCPLTEACIGHVCQRPCDVHNPCAQNSVCVNTNHGSDCSCSEGFQGNGYVGCVPVVDYKPICQYNEDCPPNKLCDRLNRICISPCFEDSCGENAECLPKNHGIECRCLPGFGGNPYTYCEEVQGCLSDIECSSNEACINGQCGSPCQCGSFAICEVVNHQPTCKCPSGYHGDPNVHCEPPTNLCDPNPCGLHALCEIDDGNPICFCPKGLTGNPFKSCIPEGDECSPNPCGPNSGCRVVDSKAVCFCLPEYEGTPPHTPCTLPSNPCHPSPCGPNTQCSILNNGFAKCTCLPGYLESPNTIRGCIEPKNNCEPNPCGFNALCDPLKDPVCYCPGGTIGNPYRVCNEPVQAPMLCSPGPCGINADCYVTNNNQEECYCKIGFVGNAYSGCKSEPVSACTPNPCGPGAICNVSHDASPICRCPEGLGGDPSGSIGCHSFECVVDDNCDDSQACLGYRCRDPCPGSCGVNAHCRVEKHHPVCSCNFGLTGNPAVRCYTIPPSDSKEDPCMPSPCGLNAICQDIGGKTMCSCLPDFQGDPQIGCHPECVINSDCSLNKACLNKRCRDPCTFNNLCGMHAVCQVQDHTATCICPDGFMGDPLYQCLEKPSITYLPTTNVTRPCSPDPCDITSQCSTYGEQIAICDPCLGVDAPFKPECRPECLTNADCPFDKACLGHSCEDPCPGSCGINADCTVISHTPICNCPPALIGDPFEHCTAPLKPVEKVDTCENIICGVNADCLEHHNGLNCICREGFFGNPWIACHAECILNPDCPLDKACINSKCIDPCAGVCGVGADCETINHVPICYCPSHYTGDPFVSCYPFIPPSPPLIIHPINPCDPSPCGPYSRCLVSQQGYATCSCLPNYHGAPPACKPECIVSSECSQTKACINQRCTDPCPGTCGINAICTVINHNPICTCPADHIGDPFENCHTYVSIEQPKLPENPCVPSPCGPNSICQVKNNRPVCSCQANYIGSPPYCRPECVINQECPKDKACVNEKCINPCTNACGSNAKCNVVSHTPYCSCLKGYEGDAFIGCSKIPLIDLPRDPCNPSPCGENAQCSVSDNEARCNCIPPYIGNPYVGGCRPECTINSDCPSHLACLAQHCRDPCQGICGMNAECSVVNHVPICSCPRGLIGDPFSSCREAPPQPPSNPCEPSPCGPNSICRERNDQAICSCQVGYFGTPPSCRPECVVSSECSQHKACINQKCQDPCLGSCGLNAKCQVVNHNPICSCPPHFIGDPFIQCEKEEMKPLPPPTPCIPSPCGPNSECRPVNSRPVCSCLPGMFGAPPNCRPECVINQDCPSNFACINNKCKDPCVGSCSFNAQCVVLNHRPTCSCLSGYEGDPFSGCIPITVELCRIDKGFVRTPEGKCVCPPNTALNENDECVLCLEQRGYKIDENSKCICALERGLIIDEKGNCVCSIEDGYHLDERGNCIPIAGCDSDEQCPDDKFCNLLTKSCENPCLDYQCGMNALCNATNHQAICQCISGYTGDANIYCNQSHPPRTDFPKPELLVNCLSDGVQIEINIMEHSFNGILYVKGHSKDEQCRRVINLSSDTSSHKEIFKVHFGSCGLIHINGQASFILVFQKHPKLVTYKTQAYHIKCIYQTGEQNVTLGFNVSMLTTAGTIANTGPPPTCKMKIITPTGEEIKSAEIGENLMLQVDVQPGSIYGGFARSCVAKTMEDNIENEYLVTDENGCATDPTIFGEWEHNSDTQSLLASFNAFKFPSSDNIRFQCNIRVCFGRCQPVNCRGYNAFGRRRRAIEDENNTDLAIPGDLLTGQLREEITIQSNAILTFEKREEKYSDPSEAVANAQRIEDICVSMIGFIIALIITALLALVAVAVAVSCWLMAYRRKPKATGPLPHPPEFPNPLFTTPEPMAEPSPDYLT